MILSDARWRSADQILARPHFTEFGPIRANPGVGLVSPRPFRCTFPSFNAKFGSLIGASGIVLRAAVSDV